MDWVALKVPKLVIADVRHVLQVVGRVVGCEVLRWNAGRRFGVLWDAGRRFGVLWDAGRRFGVLWDAGRVAVGCEVAMVLVVCSSHVDMNWCCRSSRVDRN